MGPRLPRKLDDAMISRSALVLMGVALCAAAEASPRRAESRDSQCTVTRILPDGRRVAAAMPPGVGGQVYVRRGRHGNSAGASAHASGRSVVSASSSSSSSSSSSASSSGNGRSFARSSASYTDEEGRTITTIRDGRGCTVTIDERTIGEE